MKTAIFNQYGGPECLQIADLEKPACGKGEVLVSVKAAGLNPKDILIRKGKFKQFSGRKFPQQLGFDFAGMVVESGSPNYTFGDRVLGMLNGWKGKSCAEYVRVKEPELCKMPEALGFQEAAGLPLAGQTALQAIRDIGKLQAGQSICINGASGGVGTLAIQIAKDMGARVTSISSERNLDLCGSLGADSTLDYARQNILSLNEKYDVFFDVFGNYNFQKCARVLSKRGVYITTVPKKEIFLQQVLNPFRLKKARMVVVKSKHQDIKWLAEGFVRGGIKPVVDQSFSLNEISKAHAYIETKRAKGKVILVIEPGDC